ncbi:Nramp family divalent metal transporter [Microbacterium nymphoidis]|uniref:Nramp family divalent metal transporter n=1 Tax=Microbacterium nymphoidis TaxID=2898586 RepID=UPI001E2B869D|nr:Nramp family divalent metal transporter [Microbacterium nymphoidis]MCD2499614.1 Nramp family divalent metal transporter [Microbacterium nymphoidis]
MPKTLDAPPTRVPRSGWLLGPALVAGIAYLDPGNVASNMSAGAEYGFLLVWVVVLANLMAWLVQYLSAKLGIVTGQSLAELIGARMRNRPARIVYWLQAELVVMATDIAEVIGGAVALHLLFGVPLVLGGLITGVVSLGLLMLASRRGIRPFQRVMIGMVVIIAIGFSAGMLLAPPDAGDVLGGLVPRFEGSGSVLLAASILGATVMPHAIYAHSALVRDRFGADDGTRPPVGRLLRATRWDVSIAMIAAGSVNLCMLLLAATHLPGVAGTDTIEGAHAALGSAMGPVIATLFAVGLLASGLASTSVGAYAGADVMHGLLKVDVPVLLRRAVTLIPAIIVLGLDVDPTFALVLSQVVLSFGIPFAVIPLVRLTARRDVMGAQRNHVITSTLGLLVAAALIVLNVMLLWLTFTGG